MAFGEWLKDFLGLDKSRFGYIDDPTLKEPAGQNYAGKPGAWFKAALENEQGLLFPNLRERSSLARTALRVPDVFLSGVQAPFETIARPFFGMVQDVAEQTGNAEALRKGQLWKFLEPNKGDVDYKKLFSKEGFQRGYEAWERSPDWWKWTTAIGGDPLNVVGAAGSKARSGLQVARTVKPAGELSALERLLTGTKKFAGAIGSQEELAMKKSKGLFKLLPESSAVMATVDATDILAARLTTMDNVDDMVRFTKELQEAEKFTKIGGGAKGIQPAMSVAGQKGYHLMQGFTRGDDLLAAYKLRGEIWKPIEEAAKIAGLDTNGAIQAINKDLPGFARKVGMNEKRLAEIMKAAKYTPRNADEFRAVLTNEMAEHMGKQAAKIYGVEAQKNIERVFSVLKAAQSVPFLALNPRYLVNNVANNFTTMLVYGLLSPRSASGKKFIKEVYRGTGGPTRYSAGFGGPGQEALGEFVVAKTGGVLEAAEKGAREARDIKPTKVHDAIDKLLDNPITGWIMKQSRKNEAWSSEMAYNTAFPRWFRHFFNKKTMRALPEGISPDDADWLMNLVSGAKNKDEVYKVLGTGEMTPRALLNIAIDNGKLTDSHLQVADALGVLDQPMADFTKVMREAIDKHGEMGAAVQAMEMKDLSEGLAQHGKRYLAHIFNLNDTDLSNVFSSTFHTRRAMHYNDFSRELADKQFQMFFERANERFALMDGFLQKEGIDVELSGKAKALQGELTKTRQEMDKLLKQEFAYDKENYYAQASKVWNTYKNKLSDFQDEYMEAVLSAISENPQANEIAQQIVAKRREMIRFDQEYLNQLFEQVKNADKPLEAWQMGDAVRRDHWSTYDGARIGLWRDWLNATGAAELGGAVQTPVAIEQAIGSLPKQHALRIIRKIPGFETYKMGDNIPFEKQEEVFTALDTAYTKKHGRSLSTTDIPTVTEDVGREAYETQARLDAIETVLQDEYGNKFQRIVAKHWGGKEGGLKRVRGTTTNKLQAADIADYNDYVAHPETYPWMARRINAGMNPADAMEDAIREFKNLQAEKKALKTQLADAPKITAPKTITTGVGPKETGLMPDGSFVAGTWDRVGESSGKRYFASLSDAKKEVERLTTEIDQYPEDIYKLKNWRKLKDEIDSLVAERDSILHSIELHERANIPTKLSATDKAAETIRSIPGLENYKLGDQVPEHLRSQVEQSLALSTRKKVPARAGGKVFGITPTTPGAAQKATTAPTPAQVMDFTAPMPDILDINTHSVKLLIEALDAITEESMVPRMTKRLSDLEPQTMRAVQAWVKDVLEQDIADAMAGAAAMASWQRDLVLLNYSKRYGYNKALGYIFPYEFWASTSIRNWANKFFERPELASMYARARQMLYEKTDEPGFPSRLKGMIQVPMPFQKKFGLEWAGDLYFDPLSTSGLPLENFTYGLKALDYESEKAKLQKQLDQAIARDAPDDEIAEIRSALNEARSHDMMDYAGILASPGLHVQVPYALLTQGLSGIRPMLPLSRFIKNVGAFASDAAGFDGQPLDIEGGLRRKLQDLGLNLPAGDDFENYLISRMVANMVADGDVEPEEGERAIIERSGPAWDEAKRRASVEQGLKSILPGRQSAYPTGEKEQRRLGGVLGKAYRRDDLAEALGVKGTSTRDFYEEHPEYKSRQMIFKLPGKQYTSFLTDKIWDELEKPTLQAKAIKADKTTMDALSKGKLTLEELATLADMLGISLPEAGRRDVNEPQLPPALETGKPKVDEKKERVTEEQALRYDNFLKEVEKRFGKDIYDKQSQYFDEKDKSAEAARAYLKRTPELKKYWDFSDEFRQKNPDIARMAWPKTAEDAKKTQELISVHARLKNMTRQEFAKYG